jgi:hypothetical protein
MVEVAVTGKVSDAVPVPLADIAIAHNREQYNQGKE